MVIFDKYAKLSKGTCNYCVSYLNLWSKKLPSAAAIQQQNGPSDCKSESGPLL